MAQPQPKPEPTERTVQFVQDYRGVLTGEAYFVAGEHATFPIEHADALIAHGRAVAVEPKA